jgi:predicted protein tyrosine phosphatase
MIFIGSLKWASDFQWWKPHDHLISLLDRADEMKTPEGISSAKHLKLNVRDFPKWQRDIIRGAHLPSLIAALEQLLEFGDKWDGRSNVFIHCEQGLSRSPAAALILAAQKNKGFERDVGRALRRECPFIWPNGLIIDTADDLLGLKGELVRARAAMGKPQIGEPEHPLMLQPYLQTYH